MEIVVDLHLKKIERGTDCWFLLPRVTFEILNMSRLASGGTKTDKEWTEDVRVVRREVEIFDERGRLRRRERSTEYSSKVMVKSLESSSAGPHETASWRSPYAKALGIPPVREPRLSSVESVRHVHHVPRGTPLIILSR